MLKRLRRGRETIELKIQGLGLPIVLRRSARARRFSLQVSEARRDAVLTLPAFSSYGEADEFLTSAGSRTVSPNWLRPSPSPTALSFHCVAFRIGSNLQARSAAAAWFGSRRRATRQF